MIRENRVDWALGELLAYGSLLMENHPVRISGQDSIRGTFSHRHAGMAIEDSTELYVPLKYLDKNQAPFNIYNSPLNEYGVLGFEYGYAMACPRNLIIWEAQFGDFVNVAQVILDQYISSAEEKWGVMNGLVLYLHTASRARARNIPAPALNASSAWLQGTTCTSSIPPHRPTCSMPCGFI